MKQEAPALPYLKSDLVSAHDVWLWLTSPAVKDSNASLEFITGTLRMILDTERHAAMRRGYAQSIRNARFHKRQERIATRLLKEKKTPISIGHELNFRRVMQRDRRLACVQEALAFRKGLRGA